MAKLRDASKLLPPDDPQYTNWVRHLSKIHEAGHGFNAKRPSVIEAAKFYRKQFDSWAEMALKIVHDHQSALDYGRAADDMVRKVLTNYRQWAHTALAKSRQPGVRAQATLRRQLLRRAELWKTRAHASYRDRLKETVEQRASRRKRKIDPLLKKAGILSNAAWADRAGENMDANTPRDYREGKTETLRERTRQELARALGVNPQDLPE